jgi:hypothetical protein
MDRSVLEAKLGPHCRTTLESGQSIQHVSNCWNSKRITAVIEEGVHRPSGIGNGKTGPPVLFFLVFEVCGETEAPRCTIPPPYSSLKDADQQKGHISVCVRPFQWFPSRSLGTSSS